MTATNLAPTKKGFPAGMTEERLDEIRLLLDTRRTGFSLEAPFYTDANLFNLDMQAIFSQHWVFACSVAEIPEPGDYVTLDYGPYSLIVLRTDDGGVNVLHNVCRHRGARV
ncbi:aromatic ring-hydroxylating oxygenase subunit alpha, partial [Burkholderia multivorans]